MAWLILFVAGALETVWALSMKASNGFTNPLWTAITISVAVISFWMLGYSMKTLPAGTAYAVWTGIGAVGAAIAGIVLLKEPATLIRVASIMLVVLGIVGLRLSASAQS